MSRCPFCNYPVCICDWPNTPLPHDRIADLYRRWKEAEQKEIDELNRLMALDESKEEEDESTE